MQYIIARISQTIAAYGQAVKIINVAEFATNTQCRVASATEEFLVYTHES